MPDANELPDALLEVGFSEDVTWLVKRLSWRELTTDDAWIDHIDIPPQFFRALTQVWPLTGGARFPITVASHALSGEGAARFVRRRAYIEWNVPVRTISRAGADAALIILAVRKDMPTPYLWSWICDTQEDDEYAETFFNLSGEPSAIANSRGLTMFPRVLNW